MSSRLTLAAAKQKVHLSWNALCTKIIYFADLKAPGSLKFLLLNLFFYLRTLFWNSFWRNAKHSVLCPNIFWSKIQFWGYFMSLSVGNVDVLNLPPALTSAWDLNHFQNEKNPKLFTFCWNIFLELIYGLLWIICTSFQENNNIKFNGPLLPLSKE